MLFAKWIKFTFYYLEMILNEGESSSSDDDSKWKEFVLLFYLLT